MASPAGTLTLVDSRPLRPEHDVTRWLFLLLQRDRPLAPSARYRLDQADVVTVGRAPTRAWADAAGTIALGIDDPWMSVAHARLAREGRGFVLEDAGSRNGTIRNGAPTSRAALVDGDVLELGRTFFLYREVAGVQVGHRADLDESSLAPSEMGVATLSPRLAGELDRLLLVARTTISIVVVGESGTGKEVLARALHELSGRVGAFVAINCAALPDGLVQSELFGHRRGSFSGALEDRPGFVRTADGGTLLLDELGDLGPVGQGALLRVLQEREVVPIGGGRPVAVDVRVLAATHRDLEALVAAGSFRGDLLSRLSGFVFHLPALRQRREDMGILLRAFLRALSPDPEGVTLSQEAARAVLTYDWPSNIRELQKCVAAALALAPDGAIQGDHLPAAVLARAGAAAPRASATGLIEKDLRRRERLVGLLRENGGNVSAVARAMGTARAQIHRWLRRYALDPSSFRG
jgi:transcriptional regulator with GAF, ATPase, and Fis domain